MIRQTRELGLKARLGYDAIIDVRSPGEFAEDHIPGAINLPVLDDAERIEVGTLYVQTSKFIARRTGAAHVARNIARHLETSLSDRGGGFKPLIYCWRGGQRSTAMATIMDQVGWPVSQLQGGYQTWRRLVASELYPSEGSDSGLKLTLLDGFTGTGKTEVLARLAAGGAQVIDLEALAEHRGSVFGVTGIAQPSQKQFETRLHAALESLDRDRPIIVEAESSRIGNLTLPPLLWRAMKTAPRIQLSAPLPSRVEHILNSYGSTDPEVLDAALARLPRHHSKDTVQGWRVLARDGRLAELATELITQHYDPAYRRGAIANPPCEATVELMGMTRRDFEDAAQQISTLVDSLAI
ncbi:MAG: tRNA 2-selenouridine(34) synthase MnmH [Brevundimonas sp.]|nr:tRNA 2-selenouridine(34) synthase MnmH [Brevundimonas sp.]